MHFHSLDYFLFLILVVAAYWVLIRFHLLRLLLVFLASCLFYMAWNPAYIVLILTSTVIDYIAGRAIYSAKDQVIKRRWLWLSLGGNLGLLGIFKYYNFFTSAVQDGLGLVGVPVSPIYLDVLLPVGISFYTFQTLSYSIDIYRGRFKPTRNFLKFAFFVTFFPQLVAGPIVRARDFLPQLDRLPKLDIQMVGEGAFLIAVGLIKKVVFADYLALNLVDRIFDDPSAYSAAEVMMGLYGFTMQIYCDFSGYTDVARGSALLFGLRLPENFDRPYQATSPAEFWRRWHITLSSWLRDYLYFPLGGSRGSASRAYFNLWVTMFIIGMWHGAAWTFVVYGALQATAMVIHRYFYRRSGRTRDTVDPMTVQVLKIVGTLHFSVLSRIFFRSTSMENAIHVIKQLFCGSYTLGHITGTVWLAIGISYMAHYLPRSWVEQTKQSFVLLPAPVQGFVLAGVGAILMFVATGEVVPYIYFQF